MVNFALLIYCHIGGYNDTVKRYSKNITMYLKTPNILILSKRRFYTNITAQLQCDNIQHQCT